MATSIGDDLLAKALVCSDRDTLYAIVSLDLIWLPRRFIRKVRDLISRSSAIRPENVMIACTHTHSGPDTLNWYAFAPPIAGWWMEWLAQMVASTVYLALNNVDDRSEEHTSELQSLMRISYAVFCLKTKNQKQNN